MCKSMNGWMNKQISLYSDQLENYLKTIFDLYDNQIDDKTINFKNFK